MRNIATTAARPADEALLKLWAWFSVHRKARMALIVWCVLTLCWYVNATTAHAAMELDNGSLETFFLPIGHVTDTADVPVGEYSTLPLDYGRLSYPQRLIRGVVLGIGWALYTFVVFTLLAFVEFILSFMWLDWLASPILLLTNSIDATLGRMGLIGLGLSITCLVVAVAIMRGRKGTAVVEIVMVAAVVGLIATPLGNPVSYLTGEESIVKDSSEFGQQLGDATVSEAGAADESAEEDKASAGADKDSGSPISAELVDMAVRSPAQMLSFGQELEGKCATVWNETATEPDADAERLRKQVLRCDGDLKAGNETDSWQAVGFYVMNWVGMIGLFFLIGVFGFFIIKDVMMALLGCINVLIRGYLAAFPGAGRYAFFNALAQLAVNVVMIAIYIWALSAYLWLIGEIVSSIGALPLMLGSGFIGLVVIIMTVTFFMMKRRGKKVGEAIARALANTGLNSSPEAKQHKVSYLGRKAADLGVDGAKALAKRALARRAATAGLAATGVGAVAATMVPIATQAMRKTPAITHRPAPTPALEPVGANTRGVPVGDSYGPEGPTPAPSHPTPAPKSALKPKRMQGRFHKVRVNTDGSTNALSGEVVEGDLPRHIKASRAWGTSTANITSGYVPPRRRTGTAPTQAGGGR